MEKIFLILFLRFTCIRSMEILIKCKYDNFMDNKVTIKSEICAL